MKKNGFTLIELMIVVAIIAILAAIAYPSYQDSVRKTKRAVAQADLMELASFMERFFTENNRYHQTNAATPVAVSLPTINNDDYTYSLPTKTAATFVLQAVPKSGSGQNADTGCTTLTLSNTGAKTPASCW
jgi:type IV pilus assembly protein PilE